MIFDTALVAYTPNGARLGNLPTPTELSMASPFNDMASLTFTYPIDGAGTELLKQPVEIAVEYLNPNTGTWFEPANMRFLKLEWTQDMLDELPVLRFTCPGYGWLLNKATTMPPPASVKQEAVAVAVGKAATAKAAFDASKVTVRLACGLAASGGVVLADYSPNVSGGGVWIDTSKGGDTWKGVTTGKGASRVSSWVSVPGAKSAGAAVIAAKVEYDAATSTVTGAKNNKSLARVFHNASAGQIVGTLLGEAQARGILSEMAYDFGSTRDSAGAEWAKVLGEYEVPAGTPVFRIIETLVDQGLCDWRMNGRELELFNPDTTLNVDRSATTVIVNGLDISAAPDKGTIANVVGRMLFVGDDGMNFELTNPSAPTPWGKWEGSVTQGGVSNAATGRVLGAPALVSSSAEQIESTRSLTFTGSGPVPFVDYEAGDHITAATSAGGLGSLRVRQITITRNSQGQLSGSLVLNDRFVEQSIKAARKMAGVMGGSSSGGNGAIAAPPPSNDTRTPAPAFSLALQPDVYIDGEGEARGLVIGEFQHDGTATTGTLMDIDRHVLYGAEISTHGAVGQWRSYATLSSADEEIGVQGLLVSRGDGTRQKYSFHIRTIGENGKISAPSNSVTVEMINDVEAPPAPQLLPSDVTTWLRTVKVTWQGKGMSGDIPTAMPLDFDHINVYQSTTDLGPWTVVGKMYGSLNMWQSDMMPLGPAYYCLTAVDRTGNESEKSLVQMIEPKNNVDMTAIINHIDAAEVDIVNAGKMILETGAELSTKLAENDAVLEEARADMAAVAANVDAVGSALATVDAKAIAAGSASTAAQTAAGDAQAAADTAMKRVKDAEKMLTNKLSNPRFEDGKADWASTDASWVVYETGGIEGLAARINIPANSQGLVTKLWNEEAETAANTAAFGLTTGITRVVTTASTWRFDLETTGIFYHDAEVFVTLFDLITSEITEFTSPLTNYGQAGSVTVDIKPDANGNVMFGVTAGLRVTTPATTNFGATIIVKGASLVDVTELASIDAEAKAAQAKADEAFTKATAAAVAAGDAQTSANSKNRNWYQTTAPTGTGHKVNDTWFREPDNAVHRWDGTKWVSIQDTLLADNKAAITANKAAVDAAVVRVAKTEADVVTAKADIVTAKARADKAVTDAATAQSEVNAAEVLIAGAKADILANKALIQSTQLELAPLAGEIEANATAISDAQADLTTAFGQITEAQLAAQAAAAQSEDFITDPQFLTGDDAVKSLVANAVDANAGELPNRAKSYGRVTGNDNWGLVKIKTIPGHTYRVEVDARPGAAGVPAGKNLGLMVWYLIVDGATANAYASTQNAVAGTVTEWTHGVWEWKAPADNSFPYIRPALRADSGNWLVTNFHVRDVTEAKDLAATAAADATAKANAAQTAAVAASTLVAQAKADAAQSAATTAAAADAKTKADAAQAAAVAAAKTASDLSASGAKSEAIAAATADAKTKADAAQAAAIAAAALDATAKANQAKTDAITSAANDATAKANTAKAGAIAAASTDAATKAGQAKTDAIASATTMTNGIGKNLSSTAIPTTSNLAPNGSMWRRMDGSGRIIAVWEQTGAGVAGTWTPRLITSETIDNLDVGKLSASTAVINTAVVSKIAIQAATVIELNANRITAGTINAARLNAVDVRAKFIAAGKIVAAELATDSVTTDALKAGSVVAASLAADSVTAVAIKAGTVTATEIAANAIVAGKIATNAVTTATIAAGAVTAVEIKAGTITATELGAKAVTAGKIGADAVTATEIKAGSITATELAVDSVTALQIKAGSVDLGVATVGKLSGSKIEAKSIGVETLLVGSLDNLVESPGFENKGSWSGVSAGPGSAWATSPLVPGSSNLYVMNQQPEGTSVMSLYFGMSNYIPVEPGESFRATTIARPFGAQIDYGTGSGFAQQVYFYDENKAMLAGAAGNMTAGARNKMTGYAFQEVGGLVTAPVGAVYMRPRLTVYIQNGIVPTAGRVAVGAVKVVRATGGNLIVDGAITADHVDAESVSAKLGTFIEARVDKLKVTGTANISEAVVTKLWTDVVRSKKITADMVAIGRGTNAIADPYFDDAEIKAYRGGALSTTMPGAWGRSTTTNLNWFGGNAQGTSTSIFTFHSGPTVYAPEGMIAVEGGKKYRFSVRTNSAGGGARPIAYIIRKDDSKAYVASGFNTNVSPPGNATSYAGSGTRDHDWIYTVPDDVAYMIPALQFEAACTSAFVYGGATFTGMTDASLIVDGAITAKKLTVTEEMWASIINYKLLQGDQIAANTITTDHLGVGAVTAGKIKAGAINVKGLITGNALEGTTITGATIQTIITANRGVMLNTAGLRAWNSSGVQTFNLSASTGDVSATGSFSTKSGVYGITMDNAMWDSKPGVGFDLGLTDAYQPLIYAAGSTAGGNTVGALVLQGSEATANSSGRSGLIIKPRGTGFRLLTQRGSNDGMEIDVTNKTMSIYARAGNLGIYGPMRAGQSPDDTAMFGTTPTTQSVSGTFTVTYTTPVARGKRTVQVTPDAAASFMFSKRSVSSTGFVIGFSGTANANLSFDYISTWRE